MSKDYYEPQYKPAIRSVINLFKGKRDFGFVHSDIIGERYELVFMTQGTLQMSVNGMTFKLLPYDLYIKKPNDHCTIKVADSEVVKYILINYQIYDGILSNVAGKIFHLDTEQQFMIRELYDIMSAAFANTAWRIEPKDNASEVEEKTAFLKFELFLLSLLKAQSKLPDEIVMKNIGAINYKKINDVLYENMSKKLSVPEIAAMCNMSVANVKKTMAQYADCGVMEYFTSLKISRAIDYLRGGSSVKEICDYLGFSSQSYFAQVFKRETGKTPKEYLKK